MSTFLAAAKAWLTERHEAGALPACPAENHGEAENHQQNQGCLPCLMCLTEKTIRGESEKNETEQQHPDPEREGAGSSELYPEGKTGKAVRQLKEKPIKPGVLAALRENFGGRAGEADLEIEQTGLLEREFLSPQANRYNLSASKACATCLFCDISERSAWCAWLGHVIASPLPCDGFHWTAKPDHMYVAPDERVLPHQLEGMAPEERSAAQRGIAAAKAETFRKATVVSSQRRELEELRTGSHLRQWKLEQDFDPEGRLHLGARDLRQIRNQVRTQRLSGFSASAAQQETAGRHARLE